MRLHKCDFLKDHIDYLGFDVSAEGVHASPKKVKAIIKWPTSNSAKDVRAFLGLASSYWKSVQGFSELAKPLINLTKKGIQWRWESERRRQHFLS